MRDSDCTILKRFKHWLLNYFWDGEEDFKDYMLEVKKIFSFKK